MEELRDYFESEKKDIGSEDQQENLENGIEDVE